MECIGIARKLAKANQFKLGAKKAAVKRWMRRECVEAGCPSCGERLAGTIATAKAQEAIREAWSEEEQQDSAESRKTAALAKAALHQHGIFRYGNSTMLGRLDEGKAPIHKQRSPRSIALALRAAGYSMGEATRKLTEYLKVSEANRLERMLEGNGNVDFWMLANAPRWDGKGGLGLSAIAEGILVKRGNDNSDPEQTRDMDHSNMGIAWWEAHDNRGLPFMLSIECHVGWNAKNATQKAGAIVARITYDGSNQHRCKSMLDLLQLGIMEPDTLRDCVNEAASKVNGISGPVEFMNIWCQTNGISAQERHAVQTPNHSSEGVEIVQDEDLREYVRVKGGHGPCVEVDWKTLPQYANA